MSRKLMSTESDGQVGQEKVAGLIHFAARTRLNTSGIFRNSPDWIFQWKPRTIMCYGILPSSNAETGKDKAAIARNTTAQLPGGREVQTRNAPTIGDDSGSRLEL